MRKKQYSFIAALIAGSCSVLTAQPMAGDSVLNRNITIEREYQPAIQNAGKINILPNFLEPNVVKVTPKYTDFDFPMGVERNMQYLAAADLVYQKKQSKEGFARLGFGTGFNSLADIALPIIKRPDMNLDFIVDHYGLFNAKARSTTQAALLFDKNFNSFDLYAGLGGAHDYFKYYGSTYNAMSVRSFDELAATGANFVRYTPLYTPWESELTLDSINRFPGKNNLWRFNAYTGFKNPSETDDVRYDVRLNYDLFDARYGMTEHLLDLHAFFDIRLNESRLGIALNSQNQFYKAATPDLANAAKNYYVIDVNPYYVLERPRFDLRLGVKSSFSIGQGRAFAPSPDIRFDWRAVPDFFALYIGAGGDYRLNTMNDIFRENCYFNPNALVNATYTPVNFYAGAVVKPVAGLLFDVYVDYSIITDQYFYVNKSYVNRGMSSSVLPAADSLLLTNQFDAVYSNAQLLKAGGRLAYTYHDRFFTQLSGSYNHWSVSKFDYAWYKPGWELNFDVNYRIIPQLNVYANLYAAGKRYADMGRTAPVKLDPIIHINLGASYDVMDWMSVFLRFNNLINNKYQLWAGYEAQGFNVMAGVGFSF